MSPSIKRPLLLSLMMLTAACSASGSPGSGGVDGMPSNPANVVESPQTPGAPAPTAPSAPVDDATEPLEPSLPPLEPGADGTVGPTPTPTLDGAATACAPLASLPSVQGDLRTWFTTAPIAAPASEGFREPGGTELAAFERAFRELLATGPSEDRVRDFAELGYGLSVFRQDNGGGWLLLTELPPLRGGGTFAINLSPARDMWLEAPHADSDEGTLLQSATNLVALGARALLVTGANRCADAAPSPCSGTTTVCGKRGLRVSDAAHYPNTFFTAAHRALRATYPDGVTVSIHGMDGPSGGEAAIVTDGTDVDHPGGLSVRLRNALNQHLTGKRRAYSCNAPADQGDHRPLCGTANVQGRIDNGVADACYATATVATDRFLQLEQSAQLRGTGLSSQSVTRALSDVVPCSLPGAGLGCAAAPTAIVCR